MALGAEGGGFVVRHGTVRLEGLATEINVATQSRRLLAVSLGETDVNHEDVFVVGAAGGSLVIARGGTLSFVVYVEARLFARVLGFTRRARPLDPPGGTACQADREARASESEDATATGMGNHGRACRTR